MNENIALEECGVHSKVITPNDDYHYFFGYYDLQPYNKSETLHLTHKASFRNKLQEKGYESTAYKDNNEREHENDNIRY